MQAFLRLPRRATYSQYLAVEQQSAHRHELIDGVIVAMAGGSDEHNAIAGRFATLLGNRVPRGCRYYTPDQRFWIAGRTRARYSDGSVICGRPEHPAHDGQATTNPVIVLEVLSPSSEGDDEGDKRLDFQSLVSLKAYVLAHQDQRCVKIYVRDESGKWPGEPRVVDRNGESFELSGLSGPITLAEVYDDILGEDGRSLLS